MENIASNQGSRYSILTDHNDEQIDAIDVDESLEDIWAKSREIEELKDNLQLHKAGSSVAQQRSRKGQDSINIRVAMSNENLLASIRRTSGEKSSSNSEGLISPTRRNGEGRPLEDISNLMG